MRILIIIMMALLMAASVSAGKLKFDVRQEDDDVFYASYAKVEVYRGNTLVYEGHTNKFGKLKFKVGEIPPGEYTGMVLFADKEYRFSLVINDEEAVQQITLE